MKSLSNDNLHLDFVFGLGDEQQVFLKGAKI